MRIERQDYIKKDILDPIKKIEESANDVVETLKRGDGVGAIEKINSTKNLIDEMTAKIDNVDVNNFLGQAREEIMQAKERFNSIKTNFFKIKQILKSFEERKEESTINEDIDDIKNKNIELVLEELKQDWKYVMGISSNMTFEDFVSNSTLEEKKNLIKRYYENNKNNPAKQHIIFEIDKMDEKLSA